MLALPLFTTYENLSTRVGQALGDARIEVWLVAEDGSVLNVAQGGPACRHTHSPTCAKPRRKPLTRLSSHDARGARPRVGWPGGTGRQPGPALGSVTLAWHCRRLCRV